MSAVKRKRPPQQHQKAPLHKPLIMISMVGVRTNPRYSQSVEYLQAGIPVHMPTSTKQNSRTNVRIVENLLCSGVSSGQATNTVTGENSLQQVEVKVVLLKVIFSVVTVMQTIPVKVMNMFLMVRN